MADLTVTNAFWNQVTQTLTLTFSEPIYLTAVELPALGLQNEAAETLQIDRYTQLDGSTLQCHCEVGAGVASDINTVTIDPTDWILKVSDDQPLEPTDNFPLTYVSGSAPVLILAIYNDNARTLLLRYDQDFTVVTIPYGVIRIRTAAGRRFRNATILQVDDNQFLVSMIGVQEDGQTAETCATVGIGQFVRSVVEDIPADDASEFPLTEV